MIIIEKYTKHHFQLMIHKQLNDCINYIEIVISIFV